MASHFINSPYIGPLNLAIPICITLASLVGLAMTAAARSTIAYDKSIPVAFIRPGESTHDKEYYEGPDAFLKRYQEIYGPYFTIQIYDATVTVISGPLIKELFMHEDASSWDGLNEFSGILEYYNSMRTNHHHDENQIFHELIRDCINPYLKVYAPTNFEQHQAGYDRMLAACPRQDGKIVLDDPVSIPMEMMCCAMAHMYFGPEIAKNRKVIDTLISVAHEFRYLLSIRRSSTWTKFNRHMRFKVFKQPMAHVRVLADIAAPVVMERQHLEAEATENGIHWNRPNDVLQNVMDNYDKYNFAGFEDVIGNVLILIMFSFHSVTDFAANMWYYMAAFPEYVDKLYEEQKQVLDEIQAERERERQELIKRGEPISEDLNPSRDRYLSAAALKKMVHVDSYVREHFRCRAERLNRFHIARKDVTLSNGMHFPKGSILAVNVRSGHVDFDLLGDDADEFRPWRFIGKSKASSKADLDNLVFNLGKHTCPGRVFAVQELKTILLLTVAKFSKVEAQDPALMANILVSRTGVDFPTGVIFTPRDKPFIGEGTITKDLTYDYSER
ncbi:hypothetical protein BGX26_011819 [Mortierella sp. AD094]|nr:hypothetical protein BGX26_011819 [Mortierella sp. AD094]